MTEGLEYTITSESFFSREDRQFLYNQLIDCRKHPHIMYYVHNTNKSYVTDSHYIYSSKTKCHYTVTSRHSALIAMATDLNKKICQCECHFQNYINNLLCGKTGKIKSSLKKLLASLKTIHPFFSDKQNALFYVQEKIKYYFMKSLDYFLVNDDAKENKEHVKKLLCIAMQPTLDELNTIPHEIPFKSLDTLWAEFCYYVSSPGDVSAFKKIDDRCIKEAPQINILQSLFDLDKFLTEYVLLFHSTVDQHSKRLSKGQLFCLLLQSPGANTFLMEVNRPRKITDPSTLFQIIMNSMEEKYKELDSDALTQVYQNMYKELYGVTEPEILNQITQTFIEEKERRCNQFSIDTDFNKLDILTLHMNTFFQNSSSSSFPKNCDSYYAYLNMIIRPDWDTLFKTDIYEAYSFEQLIYLELYHLLQSGAYIRECENPNCNKRFITETLKTKYCSCCSKKNTGADQKYKDKTNDRFHIIQKAVYNHCRNSIIHLPENSSLLNALGYWRGNVTNYINKLQVHEKNNMSNQEFIKNIYSKLPPKLVPHVNIEKAIQKFPD